MPCLDISEMKSKIVPLPCVIDAEFRFRRSAEQQNAAVSGDKRSAGQKYMETAMVADDLLLERYSEEEAKDHLIMLAHMVRNGVSHMGHEF